MPDTSAEERGARVPISPVLRGASLRVRSRSSLPTLLDAERPVFTTSGRAAIALALEQIAIGPGDEVLIPAYHCSVMSAPVIASGAHVIYYRLNRDLSIDIDDVKRHLTANTRCILTVHFFGFPQPLAALRALCDGAGIQLVEDCAHAFYGPQSAQIGHTGDFAVGSLMKFFPVFDGGCLVSFRRRPLPKRMFSRGILFQLKAVLHVVEYAAKWSHSRKLRNAVTLLMRIVKLIKGAALGSATRIAEASPAAALGSCDFEPQWVHTRMSVASQWIVRHADHSLSVARRRSIFQQYLAGLASQQGGEPLFHDLPAGVVPYVFPFVLAQPEKTFFALRAAGVPLYRWEDVAEEACATARYYRSRLVQFPCHDSLSDAEVTELITTIANVIGPKTEQTKLELPSEARP